MSSKSAAPAAESPKTSPSESEDEQLHLLRVLALGKAGINVGDMTVAQVAVKYSEHQEQMSAKHAQEKAEREQKAKEELHKLSLAGLMKWLRARGIQPAGMTEAQMIERQGEIKVTEQQGLEQAQREQLAAHQRIKAEKLYAGACVPLRHDANMSHLDDNAAWRKIHDQLADDLRYDGGFLMALLGRRGTGKTQIGVSLIHKACAAGMTARYIKALDLFREIRRSFTPVAKGQGGQSEADLVDDLAGYDLLIIDECHQRGETEFEQNTLINLLDRRYDAMRYTVMIANQTAQEFGAAMGDSVVSRIHESGETIECNWNTYREPKKWRDKRGALR